MGTTGGPVGIDRKDAKMNEAEAGARMGTAASEGGIGLAGRTAISAAVAGGVLTGGFVLGGLAVAGRMRSSDLLLLGSSLYLAGALLGFGHGAVLGYLGREPGTERAVARRQLRLAAGYAPFPVACGWAVSGWIAMFAGNVLAGSLWLLAGTGFGLAAGVFALGMAARYGGRSLVNAYARWPQKVAGTAIVATGFVVLALALMGLRKAAAGGTVLTGLGVFLAAGAVTLWVVGPLATAALRRRPTSR